MGISYYLGEFFVALGAVLTSAAVLRLGQARQARTRNRIGTAADQQTLIARWGLLTTGLLFLPVGFGVMFFR